MTTPEILRQEARRLRAAAIQLRTEAAGLDDDLVTVARRYPIPSATLWLGRDATRYCDDLARLTGELGPVVGDVRSFADDCDDEARRRDHRADALEQGQQPS